MSPADALYRAVCAAPHDDLPRLVYADWLEENGRGNRAEFIRVQCRLANASPADADYVDLLEREAELKAILWRELDADRPALPPGIGWEPEHRGFAERLRFGRQDISAKALASIEGISAGVPISGLRFDDLGVAQVGYLTSGGYRQTVTSLHLTTEMPSDNATGPLDIIASGAFPNLRRMWVGHLRTMPNPAPLLTSKELCGLREVRLTGIPNTAISRISWAETVQTLVMTNRLHHIRDDLPSLHTLSVSRLILDDVDAFCRDGALPRLAALTAVLNSPSHPAQPVPRRVRGSQPEVGTPLDGINTLGLITRRNRLLAVLRLLARGQGLEVTDLLSHGCVDHLRSFELEGTVANVSQVFDTVRLSGLRQLWLKCTGKRVISVKQVQSRNFWRSLTTFDAPGCPLGGVGGRLLAQLIAPNLKHLNLSGTPLGDRGAMALAGNASLANLTRLNLSACRIGSCGVEALLNSPHLQRLIELNLYANQGGEALAVLADAGVMPNLGLADVAANGVSDDLRRRLEHRSAIRVR